MLFNIVAIAVDIVIDPNRNVTNATNNPTDGHTSTMAARNWRSAAERRANKLRAEAWRAQLGLGEPPTPWWGIGLQATLNTMGATDGPRAVWSGPRQGQSQSTRPSVLSPDKPVDVPLQCARGEATNSTKLLQRVRGCFEGGGRRRGRKPQHGQRPIGRQVGLQRRMGYPS